MSFEPDREAPDTEVEDEDLSGRARATPGAWPIYWWARFFFLLGFVTAVLGYTVLLANNGFNFPQTGWLSWPNAPELFVVGLGGVCLLIGGSLFLWRPRVSRRLDLVG